MKTKHEIKNYNPSKIRILIGALKVRLLGIPDEVYERAVMLKRIKKRLKKLDYKFVNFSKERFKTTLGKVLVEIYTVLYPLKEYIKLSKPSDIKNFSFFLFNYYSNDHQKKLIENLTSRDYIKKLITSKGTKEAAKELKRLSKDLRNSFSSEVLQKINYIFSLGVSLQDFLRFDVFLLLKRFFPSISEKNLNNPGTGREVPYREIAAELKDFVDSLYLINPNLKYYSFIRVYSEYLNKQIIPEEDFLKAFTKISYLIKTNVLVLSIQYLSKDVYYKPLSSYSVKNISEDFFRDLVDFINTAQEEILKEIKTTKINAIIKELFGTVDFKETKVYTKEQHDFLVKNGFEGFYYYEQFNALKKFMLDKYNRYIRKALNTLVIKGSFSSLNLQEEYTNIYYAMNNLVEKILEFEDKMSRGEGWPRLKTLIMGKVKNSSFLYLARKNILEINTKVKDIIKEFMSIAKELTTKLKIVVIAFNKGKKEPISNIRSFAGTTTPMVVKNLATAFNEMNKFVNYLLLSLGGEKEDWELK